MACRNGSVRLIEWQECSSSRVRAIAYDEAGERILVRFTDGTEWQYLHCPPSVWADFADPQTSKGRFIHDRLDAHPNGPLVD